MTTNKRLNIYVPDADIERLRLIAFKERKSISELLRRAIKKILKNRGRGVLRDYFF